MPTPNYYKTIFSQYLSELNRLSEHTDSRFGYTYTRGKSCQIYTCMKESGLLWGKPVTYKNASEMLSGFESMIAAAKLFYLHRRDTQG